jgi:hypothetical protein
MTTATVREVLQAIRDERGYIPPTEEEMREIRQRQEERNLETDDDWLEYGAYLLEGGMPLVPDNVQMHAYSLALAHLEDIERCVQTFIDNFETLLGELRKWQQATN